MSQCPKCGSNNVKFELRSAGTKSNSRYYRTGVKNSWVLPAGKKTYASKRKHTTVGVCADCGYFWTQDATAPSNWIKWICLIISLFVLIVGGMGAYGVISSENVPLLLLQVIIAFPMAFAGLIGLGGYGNSKAAIAETGLLGLSAVGSLLFGLFTKTPVSGGILLIVVPAIISAIKAISFRKAKSNSIGQLH